MDKEHKDSWLVDSHDYDIFNIVCILAEFVINSASIIYIIKAVFPAIQRHKSLTNHLKKLRASTSEFVSRLSFPSSQLSPRSPRTPNTPKTPLSPGSTASTGKLSSPTQF